MMIKELVPQKSITIIKQSQTRCKHPRLLQKDDGDDNFDKNSDNWRDDIYVVLTFDFMLPNTNFYSTTIFDIFRFIHKHFLISINFEAAENTFFSWISLLCLLLAMFIFTQPSSESTVLGQGWWWCRFRWWGWRWWSDNDDTTLYGISWRRGPYGAIHRRWSETDVAKLAKHRLFILFIYSFTIILKPCESDQNWSSSSVCIMKWYTNTISITHKFNDTKISKKPSHPDFWGSSSWDLSLWQFLEQEGELL